MRFDNRLLLKPITIGILMMIYAGVLFFSEMPVYYSMLVFSFFILLWMNKQKFMAFLVFYVVIFFLVWGLAKLFETGLVFGAVYTMLLIILKLFPLGILSGICANFNTSEIMSSLRKIHIPNHLCIGITTFVHFIPEYKRYLGEVKEGLKVRNISFNILRPFQSIEVYLVPMIYKAFETGNILACALITKGIEYDCEKTSYVDLSLTWRDYLAILVGVSFIGTTIWIKL